MVFSLEYHDKPKKTLSETSEKSRGSQRNRDLKRAKNGQIYFPPFWYTKISWRLKSVIILDRSRLRGVTRSWIEGLDGSFHTFVSM